MANDNFKRTPQALTFTRISSWLDLLNWSLHILALVLPLSASPQSIVDFGASYPMTLKDIGNSVRLVVCRRPFGSAPNDSVYMETALASTDWTLTPIATKRLAAPGTWSFISTTMTADGLIMNGRLNVAGSNSASLVRLTDNGEVVWCNKYISGPFSVALPSEDSIVAFVNAGPLLHRVAVGPDGTVTGNIAISNTQNDLWSIGSGCATDAPSEHVVAGATYWENVPHAVIARIGPTGALWIKKYYVPIPGGVGYSGVSSIVRAQDGGYTCIINAMDDQIPGIFYYVYLMHLDGDGNVLWCLLSPGMSMGALVQLENGEYLAIVQPFDLADAEINRFSSAGELITWSDCQAPCNMNSLNEFMGTAFPGRYLKSGHKIAELGENGVPCGRSNSTTAGGPAFVTVSTISLTPVLAASPTITTVPIPLAERSAQLSATISCGTTPVPSASSADEYFRAFPVPSHGSVMLKLGSEPTLHRAVELRDAQGRVVMQCFAPGEVDITSLKPAIYDCLVVGTAMHARIVKE